MDNASTIPNFFGEQTPNEENEAISDDSRSDNVQDNGVIPCDGDPELPDETRDVTSRQANVSIAKPALARVSDEQGQNQDRKHQKEQIQDEQVPAPGEQERGRQDQEEQGPCQEQQPEQDQEQNRGDGDVDSTNAPPAKRRKTKPRRTALHEPGDGFARDERSDNTAKATRNQESSRYHRQLQASRTDPKWQSEPPFLVYQDVGPADSHSGRDFAAVAQYNVWPARTRYDWDSETRKVLISNKKGKKETIAALDTPSVRTNVLGKQWDVRFYEPPPKPSRKDAPLDDAPPNDEKGHPYKPPVYGPATSDEFADWFERIFSNTLESESWSHPTWVAWPDSTGFAVLKDAVTRPEAALTKQTGGYPSINGRAADIPIRKSRRRGANKMDKPGAERDNPVPPVEWPEALLPTNIGVFAPPGIHRLSLATKLNTKLDQWEPYHEPRYLSQFKAGTTYGPAQITAGSCMWCYPFENKHTICVPRGMGSKTAAETLEEMGWTKPGPNQQFARFTLDDDIHNRGYWLQGPGQLFFSYSAQDAKVLRGYFYTASTFADTIQALGWQFLKNYRATRNYLSEEEADLLVGIVNKLFDDGHTFKPEYLCRIATQVSQLSKEIRERRILVAYNSNEWPPIDENFERVVDALEKWHELWARKERLSW